MRHIITTICFISTLCLAQDKFQELHWEYFGQTPPGDKAEIFAPAIVSTPFNEDGGPVFTPDGKEIFWRIGGSPFSTFVYMKYEKDHWSSPEIAPFSGQYQDAAPVISPDGKKLFFTSKRPFEGVEGLSKFHTWISEKKNGIWQEPYPAGEPIDHPEDYYTIVSVCSNGNIVKHSSAPGGKGGYDLYMCRYENGKYLNQEILEGDLNTEANEYAPSISPDGSYILFQSNNRPDTTGAIDIFVSFHQENGTWSKGINLGERVNTKYVEKCPSLTPDGNYLFFTSDRPLEVKYAQYSKKKKTLEEIKKLYEFYHSPRANPHGGDVYWINTSFINELRNHL